MFIPGLIMKSKHKIYKDSKELPFYNYKRIMQTGDFLYMIKGYDSGDEVDTDPKELEVKFNELQTDFVLSVNAQSEQITDYSNYLIATMEFNKLTIVVNFIDLLIKAQGLLSEQNVTNDPEIKNILSDLLEGVKVERSSDLKIINEKLLEKISVYESNILKYKEILEKDKDSEAESESDLDKQFINVCLILEIPFPDERNISLYQFSLMTERAIERSKAIEKLNSK